MGEKEKGRSVKFLLLVGLMLAALPASAEWRAWGQQCPQQVVLVPVPAVRVAVIPVRRCVSYGWDRGVYRPARSREVVVGNMIYNRPRDPKWVHYYTPPQ